MSLFKKWTKFPSQGNYCDSRLALLNAFSGPASKIPETLLAEPLGVTSPVVRTEPPVLSLLRLGDSGECCRRDGVESQKQQSVGQSLRQREQSVSFPADGYLLNTTQAYHLNNWFENEAAEAELGEPQR